MTKIFEALQKGEGEISDLVLAAVMEERRAAGLAPPPAAPEPEEEPAGPRAVWTLPAAPEPRQQEPGTPPRIVRTIGVTLCAREPLFPMEGAAAEQYRIIRTKLIHHPKKPRMIAVLSPGSGDGKTVTSINLAGSLSMKTGSNVVLIDTDLRRTKIAEVLGLPPEPGLANVLAKQASLEEVLVRLKQLPNLFVIPAGKTAANPGELLDSDRWREFCVEIRERFDFMVLDTPPIGPVTDYDLIQRACDGGVMVFRPDHTSRSGCLEALKGIPKDKLLGVILNATEQWFMRKPQPYYYSVAPSR